MNRRKRTGISITCAVRALEYEIEQLAYEDDALGVLKAYEKEGWLKVLNPHWSTAKVDTAGWAR